MAYTVIIGFWIIVQGRKAESDTNEFQKIMLAHTFTWIAFQSMFVMSGFFIDKQIVPNLDLSNVFANKFAEFLTSTIQSKDATTGNIVSLRIFNSECGWCCFSICTYLSLQKK
ncbi:MAG: hypothetical protein MZV64_08210 [Ignavibacteriales bacterium]|nr:hypothetical protein [Ignavibacteriales bacterium]